MQKAGGETEDHNVLSLDQGKRRKTQKRIGKKGTVVPLSRQLTDKLERNVRTFCERVRKQDIADTGCQRQVRFLREVLIKKQHRTVDEIADVMQWLDEGNYKGTVRSIYLLNSPVFDEALQAIGKAKAAEAEAAEWQQRQEAAALKQAQKEARERQEQEERDEANFAALPAEEQARLIECAERQHKHKLGETEWFDNILRLTAHRLMNTEAEEQAKAERREAKRNAEAIQRREKHLAEEAQWIALIPDEELDAVIEDVYSILEITPNQDRRPRERQQLRAAESYYGRGAVQEILARFKGGLRTAENKPIVKFSEFLVLATEVGRALKNAA